MVRASMRAMLGLSLVLVIWNSSEAAVPQRTDAGPSRTLLQSIYDEDQADRRPGVDRAKREADDVVHKERVRKLIDGAELKTAEEFRQAAMIFQHSATPDDILLAHALALAAMAKGDGSARWLAAATLDRYLQETGKSQIFGTQFKIPRDPGLPVTQEPYANNLVSDDVRGALLVHSLKQQSDELKELQAARAGIAPIH